MNNERPQPPPPSARPLLHGVDWAVAAGVTEEVILGTRRRLRHRRQMRCALGGLAGVLAMGTVVWFSNFNRPGAMVPGTLSTVVNAPERQVLPDGTVVELKDGAEIAVTYTETARRVALRRGEAHFQVIRDAGRPFIVAVDAVEVRAVGTSFAVQRRQAQVEVLVTTGRVAVDRATETAVDRSVSAGQTIALLDAGKRALVEVTATSIAPAVVPMSAAEMDQRLSWRIPRLEFTRTPLAEAIPMINQHSAIKLSLADPVLAEVRISGLIRVDRIETLFHLLDVEHGIKAEHRSATDVALRPGR